MVDATAPGGAKPLFSNGYKSVVLSLLLAAYTFNFIDRTILATIGPQIAEQLKLDNTQLGLLGGLYFALLYTVLGIPVARLAERFSRVKIISISLVVWSGFTALSGLAGAQAFDFRPSQRYPDPAVMILDPSFAKYRIYSSTLEQLGSGMRWAEGPVYFPEQGCLLARKSVV